MSLQLHYTGQDYINRGLAGGSLIPGSAASIVGGCKTGKGFEFDGTVNSSLSGDLALNHTEFSLSCWFMITAKPQTGGRNVIFSTSPNVHNRILLDVDDSNKLRFIVYCGSDSSFKIVLGSVATLNKWYHVVATCDDSNKIIRIFVNGMPINQESYVGELNIANYFIIGNRIGLTQYFNGQICNFKYYDHVLSQKEIAEDYKSLMLHYKLDKPITTQVFDHSGFQRHITNLRRNTVTLDSKSQVYSASLKNDGTQRLQGDCDLTDLNGLDEGSFSFRVFLTANNISDQYVIYNMTDAIAGNGITFIFRDGLVVAYFYGTRIQFNYRPTVDTWHHIVLVKTSTQIKAYVDGVNIYTVSAATSSKNFSNITIVSSTVYGSSPITEGNVQDIRFYATVLTEQDVKDLYNVRHSIDKNGNYYTYELIEGQTGVGMKKNGQTNCDELIENEDGSFSIKSDKTIKVNNIKEI